MAAPSTITNLPAAGTITGAEVLPADQGGNGKSVSITTAGLISGTASKASPAGTELLLLNDAGTLKNATGSSLVTGSLAGAINGATASVAVAGTEFLIQSPSAGVVKKTTIAQLITQATAATQASQLPADLFFSTQAGLLRAYNLSQITDFHTVYTGGGSANAQTIAPSPAISTNLKGQIFAFIAVASNTAAATLQVGTAPALSILNVGATTLFANNIRINQLTIVQHDGTRFILLNPAPATGTFTGTGTGFSGSPTCTINWAVNGNHVDLNWASVLTGTSNATTFTITGLPAFLAPATSQAWNPVVEDSGAFAVGYMSINSTTISFGKGLSSVGGFTASGTKAFGNASQTFGYSLSP